MSQRLRRSRTEVLAALRESGALVVTNKDQAIVDGLTSTPLLGDELAAMAQTDPDLAES